MEIKKDKIKLIAMVGSGILIGALLIIGFFWYNGYYFVATDDARISADLISVNPQMPGRINNLNVQIGDVVNQGDKLGSLDTSSVMGTTDINLSAMSQSAGANAYKSEILAPIAGKVIQINVKQGQAVTASQSLMMLANTSDMYIGANIEETKINKLDVGQLVEIQVDAYPGQKFIGQIDSIGEAANSVFALMPVQSSNGNYTKVTQTIPIRVRFPELAGLSAKLGMNATIKIHVN
jgi:multidrug resistance efflux pump